MAGKTSDWRPGPTVCRCCLTEGCYKDISTEYFWMGKREVYAEMLSDTFNVSISYAQTGGRLICEPCIARLRDASDFKRQVQDCEKTFMIHLDPSTSKSGSVQIEVESVDDVKMERVKVEKDESDDDDFPGPDFGDDDDDDDLDDEPLQKYATAKVKVPKKEAVEILDMLDTSQITVKRKASSKTKEPPKKVKKKEVVVKPTTSKAKAAAAAAEKKKKEQIPMVVARRNAYMLVEHTTAYPFRNPESSVMCVYCCESFPEASTFRLHMQEKHRQFNTKLAFHHVGETYLKVDVTELKCRICDEEFCRLDDAAVHLSGEHYKEFNFSVDLGVYPFHMDSTKLSCGVCDHRAPNLRSLSRHIQKHFLQYMCENCGKEFCTNTSLVYHVRFSCSKLADNQKRCKKCRKIVKSMEEHFLESENCKQHICSSCGERYATWKLKQAHMEEIHSISRKKYPCPECILVFPNANRLKNHFITIHTDDFFACPHCGLRFDTRLKYNRHLIIHTGEKSFVCKVCSKAFNRQSTLNQHMWIHSSVKKWVCRVCEKPFNQKVCWKSHMKSHHPEAYDENA